MKSHSFCHWLLLLVLPYFLILPLENWPFPSEISKIKKNQNHNVSRNSHIYRSFFVTSLSWLQLDIQVFAHPHICTPVGTLTPDWKISPGFVSLPVLRQFSTIFSQTSSGTTISTAGPLSALSFRHVFFQLLWIKKQHLLQEVLGQFYAMLPQWHVI